jgi:hypothetical protein
MGGGHDRRPHQPRQPAIDGEAAVVMQSALARAEGHPVTPVERAVREGNDGGVRTPTPGRRAGLRTRQTVCGTGKCRKTVDLSKTVWKSPGRHPYN